MKKRIGVLLVGLALFSLIGLPLFAAGGQGGRTSGGTRKRVFFTNAFNTAPFCAPLNAQALQTAKENNIDLTIVDGQASASVQLDQIKNAISQKYDGIIYFPADKEGSITIIKTLNESRIPYAVIDSMVDDSVMPTITVFAGPDNVYMGEVAGQACVDQLGGKGNVVILEGAPGTDPATNRQKGFLNIVSKYPNIKILASQNVDGWDPAKAMTIMQDYITRFGNQIDFLFAADDGLFQGAQQAIAQAGMTGKIKAVSTGANNVGCAAIDAGQLYGSVLHSAKEEGQLGVEAVIKVMNGEIKQGDNQWLKCSSPLVTKENIEQWRGWGW
ncbi:MAG: sugar ABC transporter substrate-binding protein [Treponema sp.]|jgi:ribose transport system substrate-binding protein|nr:sugar ABC transporter substrate-binding protein [Treponema sp.]